MRLDRNLAYVGYVSNVLNCCKPWSHGTLETCPTFQRLLAFRKVTIEAVACN